MREKFVGRLLNRGYPAGFLDQICQGVSYSDRHHYLHNTTAKRGAHTVPFFTDYTTFARFAHWKEVFRRVYEKHSSSAAVQQLVPEVPMVVFYRGKNLQSTLVRAHH